MDRVLFAQRTLPPLRPDVAQDPRPYDAWVRQREATRCTNGRATARQTRALHLVMVIDGRPPVQTLDSLRSLGAQTSSHWRLTVACHHRWQPDIAAILAASPMGQMLDLQERDDAADFEGLLAAGLASAHGEDVAFISPGDLWARDAVVQLATALPRNGVVYADEDCIDDDGNHVLPRLKPAFSPEYLLHHDYVGHPLALSAEVVARLPSGSATVRQARDHDLALRACEAADTVRHIPEVLCHRRVAPSPVALDRSGGTDHVVAALARRGDRGSVDMDPSTGTFHIRRRPSLVATASIVIPFRDEPRLLRACIDSVDRTRGVVSPEYLLVDNGSVQPETATLLERLAGRPDVRILADDRPFNWAVLNNSAASHATGDVLVFLNNDVEALAVGWLDALCAQAERPDVGAVGARLLYPNRRLQHCGVVIGLGGAAGHVLVGLDEHAPGYLAMAVTSRECSAVTGACLGTRRELFESQGRFDESLGIDLNDVDYCLRLRRAGLRVLYESRAELIHHESPSRGTAGDVRDIRHFIDRWQPSIVAGDPYLSPHLTRVDSSCALRGPGEEEWWHRWHAGLSET
ncbi:MAG: glycosyltransferase [Acidimicrobiales bacterium]